MKIGMKRLITIVLVLCLVLCGCDAFGGGATEPNAPGQSGGAPTEPTRPAEVEMVDYNAPALKVKITINPELELTLSRTNEILEVKALNADAETLLAGMELVGQSYDSGIATILEEAKEQEYLKDLSKVTIAVEELSEGAWTIATEEQLKKPVEDYQQNSGVIFSCRLNPAGESLDIDGLMVIDTSCTTGVSVTVYGDASGNAKMMVYENDDGTRTENYIISDTEEIWINYYPDGSYQYSYCDGLVTQGYLEYPDGSGFTFVEYRELTDGLTQPIWYQKSYFDGSAEEYFYENSEWVRIVYTNADGSTQEEFYENGECVRTVYTDANGTVTGESSNADGIATGTNSDGSTYEITEYPNGNIKTSNTTWPNGDYWNQTYYENGNLETDIQLCEGRYVEQRYDETGLLKFYCQRDPDGVESKYDYENGKAVSYTATYPDGDYESHTYYESGVIAIQIGQIDGNYFENYYDEKGNLTKMIRLDENGNKVEVPFS